MQHKPQPGSKKNRKRFSNDKDLNKSLKALIAAGCKTRRGRHLVLTAPDGRVVTFAISPRTATSRGAAMNLLRDLRAAH